MSLLVRRRVESRAGATPINPLTYIGSIELDTASNEISFDVPEEHQNDRMYIIDALFILPNNRSTFPIPLLNTNTGQTYMTGVSSGTKQYRFYLVPGPTDGRKGIVYKGTASQPTTATAGAQTINKIRFKQIYSDGVFSQGSKLTVYSADLESYL